MEANKTSPEHWKVFVLILKNTAEQKDISNYEIAKQTGYSESTIHRVFKLEFCPKLQIFIDIMRVLELNVFFETRDSQIKLNAAFEKAMDQMGRRPEQLPKN